MFLSLRLIILFVLNNDLNQIVFIECAFVTIGKYETPDVNVKSCGLRYEPIVYKVVFGKKCFKNLYENKTVLNSLGYFWEEKPQNISTRVLNGRIAKLHEAPWAVYISIRYNDNPNREVNACSGVLVTFQWVLTAGHCFIENTTVYVFIGKVGNRKGIKIIADQWFVHPKFKRNETLFRAFDIALIKIMDRVSQTFPNTINSYRINTICLPKFSYKYNRETEWGRFYGFGYFAPEIESRVLRTIKVKLDPASLTCYQYSMICSNVTNQRQKTCYSDSGGGLIQYIGGKQERAVLVATLRGGQGGPINGTCADKTRNIYIPTARNMLWIIKTIEDSLDTFYEDYYQEEYEDDYED